MVPRIAVIRSFALILLLLCGSANTMAATDLTGGEWEVEAIQTRKGMIRLEARLVFTSQKTVPNGYELEGFFDWLCLEGGECHGRELFRGFLSRAGRLTLIGEKNTAHPKHGGPHNMTPESYTAHVSRQGNAIERGRWPSRGMPLGEWRAVRKPEQDQDTWEWIRHLPDAGHTWPHNGELKL